MTQYISVTDEVTFFQQLAETKYVAIHEGLPFTIPEGPISMVLENIDGSQRYVDQLVAGTIYELEPRPTEPEAGAAYDKVIRDRAIKKEDTAPARQHGNVNFTRGVPQTS